MLLIAIRHVRKAGVIMAELLTDEQLVMNGVVIVYEEHVTQEELDDFLEDLGIMCARSPLHDKDKYEPRNVKKWEKSHPNPTEEELKRKPVVGEYKKAHWHVPFQLRGRKKAKQVVALFAELGVKSVFKSNDKEHDLRYMCHLDSKKKERYSVDDCAFFGGIDASCMWKQTDEDKLGVYALICRHATEERITNFYDLTNWVIEQRDVDMFKAITSHSSFFQGYCGGLLRKLSSINSYEALNEKALKGLDSK